MFGTYGDILRLPGVARLTVVAFFARLPNACMGILLTLHITMTLHESYFKAGLVTTFYVVGLALGAPWWGRQIDRRGLRRALLPCVIVNAAGWAVGPFSPYEPLLAVSFVLGLFAIPVFPVTRMSLTALVPHRQRRSAFALDATFTELTFVIAPVIASAGATGWSTRGSVVVLGVATIASGVLLMVMNLPTKPPENTPPADAVRSPAASAAGGAHDDAPSRAGDGTVGTSPGTQDAASDAADGEDSGRLFTLPLIAVLCAVFAANFALSGTDLGIVACLRSWGEVSLTGIIMSVWGVTSGLAGFTYGALKRGFHPLLLAVILALVTAPVALARGGLWLGILVGVAGLLCAPTLASANNAITNIVPAGRLGLAMGWYGTVGTAASALGSPLCGTVIDNFGAPAAFLLAAGVSLVLGAGGLIATRHHDLGG